MGALAGWCGESVSIVFEPLYILGSVWCKCCKLFAPIYTAREFAESEDVHRQPRCFASTALSRLDGELAVSEPHGCRVQREDPFTY